MEIYWTCDFCVLDQRTELTHGFSPMQQTRQSACETANLPQHFLIGDAP